MQPNKETSFAVGILVLARFNPVRQSALDYDPNNKHKQHKQPLAAKPKQTEAHSWQCIHTCSLLCTCAFDISHGMFMCLEQICKHVAENWPENQNKKTKQAQTLQMHFTIYDFTCVEFS